MTVLVTGGAGYIGSHTCIELILAGHTVLVLDNLVNSSAESLRRVEAIVKQPVDFVEGDIRDTELLDRVFSEHDIESVVHFAGLKAVGESTEKPLDYYDNNVYGTLCLLQVMKRHGCKNLVFSSSATVYGDPHTVPIEEHFPLSATNPYGRSKLMIEDILRDLYASDTEWQVALLRYFNPVGAHESGTIGEDPNGIPNNLMPFITQVAIGKREALSVFGSDYDTPDGTGVRDYIHVVDLAKGHVKAIEKLDSKPGCVAYNLGTGVGYSVLDMVKALEKASGCKVPYKLVDRRPGDIACCYADPEFAEQELGWRAGLGLDEMMADSWRWQSQNPDGYKGRDL
ncbi:UDP-glucose 4-epimerase GalE [Saccharospirillum impatiens]|uniref:UDP-glucose 4-epimerase GalE n=1 Tax=Saccharospirillum impatiens TaxID=169438 RepID=UPI0003FF0048|nr:UDP-glucose 4-epimerase GalE [Saccharospirillum impatiens]